MMCGPALWGLGRLRDVYPIYRSYIVTGHAVPRSGATPDTVQRITRTAAGTGAGLMCMALTTVTTYVVECGNM